MGTKKGEERPGLERQVLEKLTSLVTAAFGLVAALAWNGAVQELFKRTLGTQDTLPAMVLYAGVVTVVAVAVTTWLGAATHRSD